MLTNNIVRINLPTPFLDSLGLQEASIVYRTHTGTLDWFVMRNTKRPTHFSIVERYTDMAAVKAHGASDQYAKTSKLLGDHLAQPVALELSVEQNNIYNTNAESMIVLSDHTRICACRREQCGLTPCRFIYI